MGLFSKKSDPLPPLAEETPAAVPGQPARKDRPTPTRREAEAARMARLNPQLDPKKAKQLDRQARNEARLKQMAAVDAVPERQLMRDVVDSRWNVGEFALPLMLLIIAASLLPPLVPYSLYTLYFMYGIIALIAIDFFFMYRRYKKLAAERFPGRRMRGAGFYGWNRQMSFRAWRRPVPRVKRGGEI